MIEREDCLGLMRYMMEIIPNYNGKFKKEMDTIYSLCAEHIEIVDSNLPIEDSIFQISSILERICFGYSCEDVNHVCKIISEVTGENINSISYIKNEKKYFLKKELPRSIGSKRKKLKLNLEDFFKNYEQK